MERRDDEESLKDQIVIEPLQEGDIDDTRYILEEHVRRMDTREVIKEEIEDDLERMRRSLNPQSEEHFFVAKTIAGLLLGLMGYGEPTKIMLKATHSDPKNTTELFLAHVANAYQRQGVGHQLIATIEREARSRGKRWLILNSGPRYKDSGWGFYDRIGYKRVGWLPNLYGSGYHAMVWKKDLRVTA